MTTLKKKPTPGLCHATRCQTPVSGTTLCPKHQGKVADVVDVGLVAVRNEVLELLTAVSTVGFADMVEVEDQTITGLDFLGQAREHARNVLKDLDEKHRVEKEPHLVGGRLVDAAYKPSRDTCKAVMKTVDERLAARVREQAEAQRQALAAVTAAAQSGDMALARVEHERAQSLVPTLPEQVRVYFDIGYELDLEGVSAEYHPLYNLLDESKIRAFGKACQGTVQLPGIRWTRIEKVRTA